MKEFCIFCDNELIAETEYHLTCYNKAEQLNESLNSKKYQIADRIRCLIKCLTNTGLIAEEVLKLKKTDFDLNRKIITSGNREFPINNQDLDFFKENFESYLVNDLFGLSKTYYQSKLNEIGFKFHDFRKIFILNLLNQNIPINKISRLLDHKHESNLSN